MLSWDWRKSLIFYSTSFLKYKSHQEIIDWFIPWTEKHFGLNNTMMLSYVSIENVGNVIPVIDKIMKPYRYNTPTSFPYHLINPDTGEKFEVLKKFIELNPKHSGVKFEFEVKAGNIFKEGESFTLIIHNKPQNCWIRFEFMEPSKQRISQLEDVLGIKLTKIGREGV
jgi:hypothetical protein